MHCEFELMMNEKLFFQCKHEHFKYRVMFFKLTNASTNFQSYIYLTLRKYLNIFCIIYFNNILIYSNNKEIHEKTCSINTQKIAHL